MLKHIGIVLSLIISLFLTACARPVPSPGDADMPAEHTIARSYVIGKTMHLTVQKATGACANWVNQQLEIKFLLPTDYRFSQKDGNVHTLISQGNYLYTIDFFRINHATLNLEGRHGFNFRFIFKNNNAGVFYAEPNKPYAQTHLEGSFILNDK